MQNKAEEMAAGARAILFGAGGGILPATQPLEPLTDDDAAPSEAPPENVEQQLQAARNQCHTWRTLAQQAAQRVSRLLSGEEAIKERRMVEYELEQFNHTTERWLTSEDERARLWELYQELSTVSGEEVSGEGDLAGPGSGPR